MEAAQSTLDESRLGRLIEVGRRLVAELDPDALVRDALEAARELTGARYAALGILDSDRTGLEHFVTSGMEPEAIEAIDHRPLGLGILGLLIDDPHPLVLADVAEHPRSHGFPPNHPPMKSFLGVPVLIRGAAWGNLYLTEKQGGDFDDADEQAAVILAEWIAVAVNNARSVETERFRLAIEAAEQERRRWARELHDETLQNLAGLRVILSAAARKTESPECSAVVGTSIDRVDETIREMRRLIADLRPAALDELGIEPALRALVERMESDSDLRVDLLVALEDDSEFGDGDRSKRLMPQLEDTIYRLIQESLNNAVRHGGARRAIVELIEEEGEITVRVTDDGSGFDPEEPAAGYGLLGMKERVGLAGGDLEIESGERGTTVQAVLDPRRRAQA